MRKDWLIWIAAAALFFAGAAWAQMMQALFGEERGLWYFLSELEDAAAWVQAFGVIGAIGVSAFLAKQQLEAVAKERRYQQQRQREAAISILESSSQYAKTIIELSEKRAPPYALKAAYELNLQVAMDACAASIDGFPWHDVASGKPLYNVLQLKSSFVQSKPVIEGLIADELIPVAGYQMLGAYGRIAEISAKEAIEEILAAS